MLKKALVCCVLVLAVLLVGVVDSSSQPSSPSKGTVTSKKSFPPKGVGGPIDLSEGTPVGVEVRKATTRIDIERSLPAGRSHSIPQLLERLAQIKAQREELDKEQAEIIHRIREEIQRQRRELAVYEKGLGVYEKPTHSKEKGP
jgi:hypothetical protein